MSGRNKRSHDVIDLTADDELERPQRKAPRLPLSTLTVNQPSPTIRGSWTQDEDDEQDEIIDLTQVVDENSVAFLEIGRMGISQPRFAHPKSADPL